MLGKAVSEVQENRLPSLKALSAKWGGCWVVLKGHRSLIGREAGPCFVNSSGNPHLAQGGAGDILAGFLAGLLAQPTLQLDPATTTRYAVWRHGAGADSLNQRMPNWTMDDLELELGHR